MGRVKIAIKRLQEMSNRKITYAKRKTGIMKKARELSILCDVDVFLLMFSPTGKPTVYLGETRNAQEILHKFYDIPKEERSKRKLDALGALQKSFKNTDHEVDIHELLKERWDVCSPGIEKLYNELKTIQEEYTKVQQKIQSNIQRKAGYFCIDPDRIITLNQAQYEEKKIKETLSRLQFEKRILRNDFIPTSTQCYPNHIYFPSINECTYHLENFASMKNDDQQFMGLKHPTSRISQREEKLFPSPIEYPNHSQPCSSIPNDNRQLMILEEPNTRIHPRDVNQLTGVSPSIPSWSMDDDFYIVNESMDSILNGFDDVIKFLF